MLCREIGSAKFPKRGIQITDVDHVSRRVIDSDPVADFVRGLHYQVYPADKTRDRCLKGEAENEREQSERDRGRIPVREEYSEDDEEDREISDQVYDPVQVVTPCRVIERLDQKAFDERLSDQHKDGGH